MRGMDSGSALRLDGMTKSCLLLNPSTLLSPQAGKVHKRIWFNLAP